MSTGDGDNGLAAVSPGQMYSARVLSVQRGRRFITYVQVDFGWPDSRGGVAVFAVPFADAPVEVSWRGEAQLAVSYRWEQTPFIKHRRAELDGQAVDIQYQAVGRAEEPLAPESYRGALGEVAPGEFRYDYYDVREADSSLDYLAAKGFRGGGESWTGIVYGLLMLRRPDVLELVRFDPEAEGLAVRSSNREALETIARLVTDAKQDRYLLDLAIKTAVAAGEMA
jgi:hypothetical protein